jgi:hypothetical protein
LKQAKEKEDNNLLIYKCYTFLGVEDVCSLNPIDDDWTRDHVKQGVLSNPARRSTYPIPEEKERVSANKDNEETLHQLKSRLQQLESHLQRLESQRREEEYKQEEAKRREQKVAGIGLGSGMILGTIFLFIFLLTHSASYPAGLNCLLGIFILFWGIGGLLVAAKSFEQ